MRRTGKGITASLLATAIVLLVVLTMGMEPAAAAPPVPPGEEGIYFLVPKDTTAQYCENVTIEVWVNSSEPIRSGSVHIVSDNPQCGEIVDCEYNSTVWITSGTQYVWDSTGSHNVAGDAYIPGGYAARLTFYDPEGVKGPGVYLCGEIEVHCNCTSSCLANLTYDWYYTYITDQYIDYEVPLENGTFQCLGEPIPTINVDIRADSITGNIFDVSSYSVNPGTVTEDGITINNQTAMGAMVVYCQENSVPVDVTMSAWGEYVVQVGTDPNDMYTWMYAVDEAIPPVGGAAYPLSGGEKVHWFNYGLNYYTVLTILDKTSIYLGDDITATVTWKNTTGTHPLSGASVNETDTLDEYGSPTTGTLVGTTDSDGNCIFEADETGRWYVYAEHSTYGSGQYNWPTPYYDCWLPPEPDLEVTDIWTDVKEGKKFNTTIIYYSITNNGDAEAGRSVSNLTVDGVEQKKKGRVGPLAPGETIPGVFKYRGTPESTIKVCADCKNRIAESDETNNCRKEPYP